MSKDRRFLNLWPPDELRKIEMRDGLLLHRRTRDLHADDPLAARSSGCRSSPRPRARSGASQIQNRGTLGATVANASPAGDTLPVLAAGEAVLVLKSAGATRRVAFNSFYTGYRNSVKRPDELIAAVEIPTVAGRQWFRKVGTRAAQAISKVVMAAVRAPQPRLALGSVAPTVIRLPETEAAAAGGSIADARETRAREIQPIDDLRSTAEYRRRVSGNLLERF
jgi:CO/xanthine dehydrogenase FAD-binding subunit